MKPTSHGRWILLAALAVICAIGYHFTGKPPSDQSAGQRQGIDPAIFAPLRQNQRIYRTAATLAAVADSSEERGLSLQTQHVADELLDVSFAIALVESAQKAAASGAANTPEAKADHARVAAIKQALASDNALIAALKRAPPTATGTQSQLEIAEAQLALDQDRFTDASSDAARDDSGGQGRLEQLQQEHEAQHGGAATGAVGGSDQSQLAASAEARKPTTARGLVGDLHAAWLLTDKLHRLEAAEAAVRATIPGIIAEHDRLHAQFVAAEHQAAAPGADRLRALAQQQEQVSRFDQESEAAGELADVYASWEPIARDQRTLVLHRALLSLLIILCLLAALAIFIATLEHALSRSRWEHKRVKTMRHVVGLAVEALVALCVLMICFGEPTQLLTIIGLAGAALTVTFQDAILSIAGWFVLMGRAGVHLGDWVEINGVVGEVIEIRLLRTVVLETGNWITAGHPTGRRVFFPNSFALKGSYFNYSTVGQWLWDELQVQLPPGIDAHEAMKKTEAAIAQELGPQSERAQNEWQQLRAQAPFSTAPTVQLRPTGGQFNLVVRYTTPAHQRTEMRERLWGVIAATLESMNATVTKASGAKATPA
ncbi:MAG TPA: mechanosensitive ion channel domain-containing protein [Terriglobales bacterium]|nr:mechanosensitive ion channel domain-containing protein [Terriglobales bacterium]